MTPALRISFMLAGFAGAIPLASGADAQHYKTDRALAAKVENAMARNSYIGMWVTADGHIRQELLANGRYDEARGQRNSAYQGRYEITGNRINYWDDTGFTADGTFVNADELHHGGMIFLRDK